MSSKNKKIEYVLVNADILPQVYTKVLTAKRLLAVGEAASASQAAKMAGISRSAYYKYKDAIFEYTGNNDDGIITVNAKLADSAGVLSSFMAELYKAGANVLSVNQSVPVNGAANVSVTVRIDDITVSVDDLTEILNNLGGINDVNLL